MTALMLVVATSFGAPTCSKYTTTSKVLAVSNEARAVLAGARHDGVTWAVEHPLGSLYAELVAAGAMSGSAPRWRVTNAGLRMKAEIGRMLRNGRLMVA
jgi:hypothetical protein